MADSVGTLKTNVIANASGFIAGMNQAAAAAKSGVARIKQSFAGVTGALGKAGINLPGEVSGLAGGLMSPGMMGAGAVGALYSTQQMFASQAKEMQHSAARMGMGVEQYQEFSRAAYKSGASTEMAAAGLVKMRQAVFQANTGNTQLTNTFRLMGTSAQQLMRMDSAEQFEAIAKGLSKISNTNVRAGIERELFGKSGSQLDPMLMNVGQGGLKKYQKWHDLTGGDAQVLAETKNSFTKEMPAMARKAAAGIQSWLNADFAEVVGWAHGRMGAGADYLKDLDIQDSMRKANSKRSLDAGMPESTHAFAPLALAGTQAGAEASLGWQFNIGDKLDKTNELLQGIYDRNGGSGTAGEVQGGI